MRAAQLSIVLCGLLAAESRAQYEPPVLYDGARHTTENKLVDTVGPRPRTGFTFSVWDSAVHEDDFSSNILVGDVNNNGAREFLINHEPTDGSIYNQLVFYEEELDGTFEPVYVTTPPNPVELLAMGDVDDDGLTDVFLSTGYCFGRFERYECRTPNGFPKDRVWTAPRDGNLVLSRGVIADTDSDGLKEFVVVDATYSCNSQQLKIFESADNNDMVATQVITLTGGFPGNPVVGDLDMDGNNEVHIAFGPLQNSFVSTYEATGDNTLVNVSNVADPEWNAYQLTFVDASDSPDGIARLFRASQWGSDHRIIVYESNGDDDIVRVGQTEVISTVIAVAQIASADLVGDSVPEIVVSRIGGLVNIYALEDGGELTLIDQPFVTNSLEIAVMQQNAWHSGAIAVTTFPDAEDNPSGPTAILRSY